MIDPPDIDVPDFDDRLLRPREAGAVLGCSPRTVRNMAQQGLFTKIMIGGSVRIRRSEIQAAMEKGTSLVP